MGKDWILLFDVFFLNQIFIMFIRLLSLGSPLQGHLLQQKTFFLILHLLRKILFFIPSSQRSDISMRFLFLFFCVVFCLNILKFEGTCFSFL